MNIPPKFGDIWSNLGGSTSLIFTKQGTFTKFLDYQKCQNLTSIFGDFFVIFGDEVYLHGVRGTDDSPRWDQMGRNFVEMLFEVRGAFSQSFSPFRYIYHGQLIVKSQPWVYVSVLTIEIHPVSVFWRRNANQGSGIPSETPGNNRKVGGWKIRALAAFYVFHKRGFWFRVLIYAYRQSPFCFADVYLLARTSIFIDYVARKKDFIFGWGTWTVAG